ncbi:MAG TPA: undecaprenyl-phosphate alpha-N-acetylglucosaminyl 1-phosphate transferase [Clostridiales bacterium]|jgi:UDP-GlcNAc:undecaprenyl-phosphate GlcNAc-1-phosphate transferase|nr:undecaprenyl-phosphate alpha-N-acetylglucosaminyl 1-phosphate transferase [Clostridiales bacterium]
MNEYYLVFFTAFVLSFFFTPVARQLAFKLGILDIPKDDRKVHKEPIPYLGGAAIYASAIFTMLIFSDLDKTAVSIMVGGTVIFLIGLIDDIKDISPKLKLAGQIIAAMIAVYGGAKINYITNPIPGYNVIYLEHFATPISILWIVGITNTINLVDGLDGLASGVAAISASTMMFMASISGFDYILLECAVIAGSSLGFLPYNFNPAKIFMGDTGALFLGYMLAVISILGFLKTVTLAAIIIMVLVLGIPLFDTFFAIVRRIRNKKPIMEADRGHVHHRLLAKGFTQRQTVLILYIVSILFGAAAIFFSDSEPLEGSLVIGAVSIIIVYTGKKLGFISKVNEEEDKDQEE